MLRTIEVCRRLWNDALSHPKSRWEKEGASTSYTMQQWILTRERKRDPELREVYSQVAQNVLRRLDNAFQSFFDRVSKYPRFKPFKEYGSFTYPQAYNGSVFLEGRKVHFSKVGDIPIVVHRQVPTDGRLKLCTVRREACGEWYAILVYETYEREPIEKEVFESPAGIDLGLDSIITTTDGLKVSPPKFLRKSEKRLKRLQRRLSRKKKGSKNREKARHLVAVQHSKVRRQRENFNQVLSAAIVAKYDFVAMEDLDIRNMVKNHSLAKSIQDAGWYQLKTFIDYKERKIGGLMQPVEPAFTSQDCFLCSARNDVTLGVRVFVCAGCGRQLDRDFNASWQVLSRGLCKIGQDMPEYTPVEIGPPSNQSTGSASPVAEAGTVFGGVSL